MSKTLANLRVGVRMYLDESNEADFLDTEVDREINYAYQDLVGKVMEVYEGYYNTVTPKSYTTSDNVSEYTLDTTLLKITRVEVNYQPSNANSEAVRATRISMESIPQNLDSSSLTSATGGGVGYYINGMESVQEIGIVPAPSEGGADALKVWGVEAPADLSQSTDAVKIPYADRFSSLIEMRAAAHLLKKGQQEVGAANDLLQEYRTGVIEMQTFLKERQSDGVVMIEDAALEDIDFSTPF